MLNDALMKQMTGLESSMHAKEETLRAQNEIITELSEQKKRLQDENARLTMRCIEYSGREDEAWRLNKLQAERMDALWGFTQMVSLSLVDDAAVPSDLRKQTMGFVYRDMIRFSSLSSLTSLLLVDPRMHFYGMQTSNCTALAHAVGDEISCVLTRLSKRGSSSWCIVNARRSTVFDQGPSLGRRGPLMSRHFAPHPGAMAAEHLATHETERGAVIQTQHVKCTHDGEGGGVSQTLKLKS